MRFAAGYLLTGWLWGALSAWYNRDAQSRAAMWKRVGYLLVWTALWPLCVAVMLGMAVTKSRG